MIEPTKERRPVMKKILRTLAATCAFIPLAQCSLFPGGNAVMAVEPAQEVAAPAVAEGVDADPALWVVKDEATTLSLFGTVHVLKPGLSWFDEAVKAAFDKSDELMLEIAMPEDQEAMAQTLRPLEIGRATDRERVCQHG